MWNANTLLLACAVLAAAVTAAVRSSNLAALALVGLPGLLLVWGYSAWQARNWHDGPSGKDEPSPADLLAGHTPKPHDSPSFRA